MDIFDLPTLDAGTLAISWDPAAERFVRLTVSATGRILARASLEPTERRAVLRCLMATRTQADDQRAVVLFMQRMGLVAGAAISLPEKDRPLVVDVLSRRFMAGFKMPDIEAFADYMEIGIHAVLVLAWAIAMVRAVPGQALPRLEDLDADLPWMPPVGLPAAHASFDARAVLAEIEAEEPDDGTPWVGHRRGI